MIWIDTLVQGVLLGGLYALFAAGLSLVFGIMRLVNLAHGDLIVMGAYRILVLVTLLGLSPFVALLIAMPLMFALGWVLQKFLLNRTLGDDILPPLLVTFGLSIVLQNALLEGFSADSQRLPTDALTTASVSHLFKVASLSHKIHLCVSLVGFHASCWEFLSLFFQKTATPSFSSAQPGASEDPCCIGTEVNVNHRFLRAKTKPVGR